jgi:solute:Na+ symporter, SSS family
VGGVKAVIWTDAVQFGLFLFGGLFTLCYIPHFFGGGSSEVLVMAADAGKLHWLNVAVTWRSLWQDPMNIWAGVIGGTFLVMSTHGAEQLIVQRVLACKNVRDGRRALILSAVVILPLFLVFLLAGVMLWAYYQKFPLGIPVPEVRPHSGIKANDFIFPIFMLTAVPHLLKGLLIVAILAAAMSSVSSAMTSLASVSTMDFAKKMLSKKSDEFFLRFSKVSTIFWAAALVIVAALSRQRPSVLDTAFSLRGLTGGALLGGLILAIWWRRGSAIPIITGMVCSLVVMIFVTNPKSSFPIYFPWYTMIGCVITIVVATVVRAITGKGPRAEELRNGR